MIDLAPRPQTPDWTAATAHLLAADPTLATRIKRAGPCTLTPRKDPFWALCQSVISQQVSTKAAVTVTARVKALFPRGRPTPVVLAGMSDDELQPAGIGRQKAAYMRAVGAAFVDGTLPTRGWDRLDDEAVIERLTEVRGIGRWTAEMFLMFVLARPDVLPVDDLGLQIAVQSVRGLGHRPKKKELTAIGEVWRPYRTIATWYLWRSSAVYPEAEATSARPAGGPS